MATKSICDKCLYRWSSGGKLFCTHSNFGKCQYSKNKKDYQLVPMWWNVEKV